MYINTLQKGDVCVQQNVPAKCFKKYKKTHVVLTFFRAIFDLSNKIALLILLWL